jgi:hypothetical protein
MRVQPLIAVRDVTASSRWYQELLGCASGPGAWGAHAHPNLSDPTRRPTATACCSGSRPTRSTRQSRGRALGAEIIQAPFVNPNARHLECWQRDLDGYVVVLASRDGDVG